MTESNVSEPIYFYRKKDPYYQFTNFWICHIELDGCKWPTVEHYFQHAKFIDSSLHRPTIKNAPTANQARTRGRDKKYADDIRPDWDTYRLIVMKKALHAKFTQNEELKTLLMSTDTAELIEDSPTDSFWGIGKKGSGQNHLGRLLMELRTQLLTESIDSPTI